MHVHIRLVILLLLSYNNYYIYTVCILRINYVCVHFFNNNESYSYSRVVCILRVVAIV